MNSNEFIKLCKSNDINEVQIMETEDYSALIATENNAIKKNQTIQVKNYLIKAKYLDKWVTISSEILDESLVNEIKEIAKYTEKAEEFTLTNKIEVENNYKLEKKEINKYANLLIDIANKHLKNKDLKSIGQDIAYNAITKRIVNTNGLDASSTSSLYEYSIESIANNGSENTCTWDAIAAKNESELNIEKIASDVIDLSILHLDENNIENNKYKVLLAPRVFSDIISYLLLMLNGDNVNKNISMLQGKLNTKMYSDKLTIIEDALDKSAPLHRTFDDEGTKTSRNILIKNGVVNSYLHNNNSAKDANTISTGNAFNGSIGYRNVCVSPGNKSYEELVSSIDYGIEITEIFISVSAKNVGTGIYSGSLVGHIIENGKRTKAIKNAIMNTSLDELLNNIIDMSNEAIYARTTIKVPYALVDNIVVTGTGE